MGYLMRYLLFIMLLLVSISALASNPVRITAISMQPSATFTRISFILSQQTTGKVKYVPAAKQVIVDFAHTTKRFAMHNARLGGANVVSVNAIDMPNQSVRFVFLVKDKVRWTIQFLPNDKTNGVRLQLDIISLPTHKHNVKPHISRAFEEDVFKLLAEHSVESKMNGNIQSADQATAPPEKKHRLFTVVIDAGHGGRDAGAKGCDGANEKTVVLAIARRLAQMINQSSTMRAVMTRDGDYFVPLRQRLKLARKDEADLFVAIHADAYFEKNARGASVYAQSTHGATSEAARWLAQKDNYSELDGVELNALQDRSTVLRSVLIDLAQTVTIQDSLRLGRNVLNSLDDISVLHYKHVEQAPFMVLRSPDIPSVLIETGFISNPYEEKRLSDPRYQEKLAAAIFNGICAYAGSV